MDDTQELIRDGRRFREIRERNTYWHELHVAQIRGLILRLRSGEDDTARFDAADKLAHMLAVEADAIARAEVAEAERDRLQAELDAMTNACAAALA